MVHNPHYVRLKKAYAALQDENAAKLQTLDNLSKEIARLLLSRNEIEKQLHESRTNCDEWCRQITQFTKREAALELRCSRLERIIDGLHLVCEHAVSKPS